MNLAPAKSRAWEYVTRRGYLTQHQVKEALDFGLSAGGPSLREIREAILAEFAKTESMDKRNYLLTALDAIDEARK